MFLYTVLLRKHAVNAACQLITTEIHRSDPPPLPLHIGGHYSSEGDLEVAIIQVKVTLKCPLLPVADPEIIIIPLLPRTDPEQ